MSRVNRRHVLTSTLAAGAAGALMIPPNGFAVDGNANNPATRSDAEPFRYCLNTSTLRGHKLALPEIIEIAAKAGFQAIEPWISEMRAHKEGGGSLVDLGKHIKDLGMTVANVIGFAEWIIDDDGKRAKGLEQAKKDMEIAHELGAARIAAPPSGATKQADLNLYKAGERFRQLIEAGESIGVVPQLELWGFSDALKRLSEVLFVAAESGHPNACVLLDVYHLYKGGTPAASLKMLNGQRMHVLHMNDYPADPPRETISDAQRVYPGDGVAPLSEILRTLKEVGFRGDLSLELFNRDYWSQDPVKVARTGYEKLRVAVAAAKLGAS